MKSAKFVAEAQPDDKAALVQKLQEEEYTGAVIGDRINCSPALLRFGTSSATGIPYASRIGQEAAIEGSASRIG